MNYISALKNHRFALEFNAVILLIVLWYAKSFLPYLSFVLVLFLPGYLLCMLLKRGEYESVALSIPLSYFLVGFLAYLADYLAPGSINFWTVALINTFLIAAYAAVVFHKKKRGKSAEVHEVGANTSAIAKYYLLLVIAIAFYAHTSYIGGGDIASLYPHIVRSFDSSNQLTQMIWMGEAGTNEFAPALHNGKAGTEDMLYTPLSVIVPTLLGIAGKMQMWNAEVFFLSLIFVAKILGVFLLFRNFFGEKIGVIASLSAGVPQTAYLLFMPYLGVWRVPISEMLLPFLLLYALKFREGKNYIVSAFLFSALALTHPPYALIFLPLALLPVVWLAKSGNKKELAIKVIIVAIAVAAVTATYYFRASTLYSHPSLSLYLKSDAVFASDRNELKAIAVGLLGSNGYPSANNLPMKTLLSVPLSFIFIAYWMKKSLNPGIGKAELFWFGIFFIFTAFLVSGFVVWWALFMVKLRFTFLNTLVMPVAGVAIYFIIKRTFYDLKIGLKGSDLFPFALSFAAIIYLGAPWTYGAGTGGIMNPVTYDALRWVGQNTESNATILYLTGYPQGAGCLSQRPCYEAYNMGDIAEEYNTHGSNMSLMYAISGNCVPSVVRESVFKAKISECGGKENVGNVLSYDYVVVAHYREIAPATYAIVKKLEENRYAVVYAKDGVTISKKADA